AQGVSLASPERRTEVLRYRRFRGGSRPCVAERSIPVAQGVSLAAPERRTEVLRYRRFRGLSGHEDTKSRRGPHGPSVSETLMLRTMRRRATIGCQAAFVSGAGGCD